MKRSLFLLWLGLCLVLILAAVGQSVWGITTGQGDGSTQVLGAQINQTPTATTTAIATLSPLGTPGPTFTPVATLSNTYLDQ
jgi:hypothetical protein